MDSPYWGTEHVYGRGLFDHHQFEQLSATLQRLQSRFILSLNDVPEERELFAWGASETIAELTGGWRGQEQAGQGLVIMPVPRTIL